jgi:hypothetical protein
MAETAKWQMANGKMANDKIAKWQKESAAGIGEPVRSTPTALGSPSGDSTWKADEMGWNTPSPSGQCEYSIVKRLTKVNSIVCVGVLPLFPPASARTILFAPP